MATVELQNITISNDDDELLTIAQGVARDVENLETRLAKLAEDNITLQVEINNGDITAIIE